MNNRTTKLRLKLHSECIWEDCDQEACYCAGHALEFANVSSEGEAIRLRHTQTALAGVLRRIATESTDPLAAAAAQSVLDEHGLESRPFQKLGLAL